MYVPLAVFALVGPLSFPVPVTMGAGHSQLPVPVLASRNSQRVCSWVTEIFHADKARAAPSFLTLISCIILINLSK